MKPELSDGNVRSQRGRETHGSLLQDAQALCSPGFAQTLSQHLSCSQWKRCAASVFSLVSLNVKGVSNAGSFKRGGMEGESSWDPNPGISKEGCLTGDPGPAPPFWEPPNG